MTRTSFRHWNCSWARTADVMGDKWTILILRDAVIGTRTFAAFEKSLGISKSVLSQRLDFLLEEGVMDKMLVGIGSSRAEYVLTEKGRDLFTVIIALGQWGDKWIMGEGNEPWIVVDKKSMKPLKRVSVKTANNREVDLDAITFVAGPGSNKRIREVAKEIQSK